MRIDFLIDVVFCYYVYIVTERTREHVYVSAHLTAMVLVELTDTN